MPRTVYYSVDAHAEYSSWYDAGRYDREAGRCYDDPRDAEPDASDDAVLGYTDGYALREPARFRLVIS